MYILATFVKIWATFYRTGGKLNHANRIQIPTTTNQGIHSVLHNQKFKNLFCQNHFTFVNVKEF